MIDLDIKDLEQLKEFVKFKRENPEEYKQFFKDIKMIMLDLMRVAKEINEELE